MGSFEEVLHNQLEELRAHLLQAHAESSVERFERERTRTWSFQKVNQGISLDALDARVPVEDQSVDLEEMQRMLTSVRPAEEKWASFITRMQNRNSYYVPTEKILTLHSDWISTAPGKQQGRRGATLHQSDPAIEGQPLFKGAAEDVSHMLKRGCSKLILRPQSNIRLTMSILGLIAIVWDVVFIPIQAFDDLPVAFDDFLMQITYAVFAYWFLDFLLQFVSAPETGQGVRAETRLHTVAIRYLKSWFVIDATILGLDIGLFIAEANLKSDSATMSTIQSVRLLRVLRLLRFARLIRISRVQKSLLSIVTRFTSVYFWMAMQMMKGIVVILVINHYLAIGWLVLGKYFWYSSTWVDNADIRGREFSDQYVTSFHWSLAQFLPSTTDIAPTNGLERLYAVLAVLLAFGVISSFITGVTNTVNALRAVRVSTVTQEAKLRQFFSDRRLPASLLKNCLTAFREKADKTQYISEEDVSILQSSPERLKAQLHEEMFKGVLLSRLWMQFAFRYDNTGLMTNLCHLALCEKCTRRSEDVFLPGTDCTGAIILNHGSMTYSTGELVMMPSSSVATASSASSSGSGSERARRRAAAQFMAMEISEGTWLCEIALWTQWWHRGQLAAQGAALYTYVDVAKFMRLVIETGGYSYMYLRTVGILMTAVMEDMMNGDAENDLSINEERQQEICERAFHFQQLARVSLAAVMRGARDNDEES
mmetsp:Transcript_59248/g.138747  ORF Transcript_59248/g.138747 Transcript_59248/m.138747 type:complete len:709 (-) Transcript_59248:61-2187(-)